jgi:hypothetical protein
VSFDARMCSDVLCASHIWAHFFRSLQNYGLGASATFVRSIHSLANKTNHRFFHGRTQHVINECLTLLTAPWMHPLRRVRIVRCIVCLLIVRLLRCSATGSCGWTLVLTVGCPNTSFIRQWRAQHDENDVGGGRLVGW